MSRLLPKHRFEEIKREQRQAKLDKRRKVAAVSYTHLRAHET